METVYIETTVISYLTAQPSRDVRVAGHQKTTQDWWTKRRAEFTCYVSQVVIDEVSAGDSVEAGKRMNAIRDVPKLDLTESADAIASAVLARGILPEKAARDAGHLAVATVHGIDFLLTWNCKHLANAKILRRIEALITELGYRIPTICTPDELLGE